MNVLVINAGSSSLKYQLFDMSNDRLMAKGQYERIGIEGGKYKYDANGEKQTGEIELRDHSDAIRHLISMLTDAKCGTISSMKEIDAVGHRVVTAGEEFDHSVLITPETLKAIEKCNPLAPLHNPANLTGIAACSEVMPGVPQVAVFDTAFHAKMPAKAFLYAIPYDYYTKYRVRRYGFHGTSHRYVSKKAAEMMGRPLSELKIITCHIGNGSSIAAIDGGISVDTSMGFTPLEGLPMGTRSGTVDAAIVEFICNNEGKNASEVLNILNKQSGLLGVSGVSSDCRDVEAAAAEGNTRAKLALDMLDYSIRKYIGAYAAAMGGVDAVVFTAGVGENNAVMRQNVADGLGFMGIAVDPHKNNVRGKAVDVSAEGAKVRTFVIPTDEELVIAEDTIAIVSGKELK
ncbi:MAG: acetate kinase [Clostridia bacterium]|nr:acetate kinase [Clostridia bacterium]